MKIRQIATITIALLCFGIANAQENSDYEDAYKSFENGKIDESYIYLKRSLNEYPDHLPSKILMAEVLGMSGFYEDSQIEFEESLQAGADPNLVLEPYIKVLLILKQPETVIEIKENQLTTNKLAYLLSAKAIAYTQLRKINEAQNYHERALVTAPANVIVLNSAAQFFLDIGKLPKAKSILDQAINNPTQAAESYQLYGKYFAKSNQVDEQINMLLKGLSISTDHPIILRDLVTAYTSKNDFMAAKNVIEATLKQSPNDPMAQLLLSWVASELNDSELSSSTLDALVNNLSLLDGDDLANNDGMQLVSAMANFAANNLEVAKNQFEQYLSKNPEHFPASKLLVDVYTQERNYLAAANLLERFNDKLQSDVALVAQLCDLYLNAKLNHKCDALLVKVRNNFENEQAYIQTQAKLYEARGKLDLALQSLDKLPSNNLNVTIQRTMVALRSNEFELAEANIEKLLQADPANLDFLNLKASLFKERGELGEAIELYERILTSDRKHYSANFNLAVIYYAQSNLNTARRITSTLLESRPNDLSLLILHARVLIRLGENELALESLNIADAAHRETRELNEAYIDLYMTNADYENAEAYVNKIMRNNFTDPELIILKARIDRAQGENDEAMKGLRALFGIVSNDFDQVYQLSKLQSDYGDVSSALRSLERANELSPNNFFVKRDLARIGLTLGNMPMAEDSLAWLNKQVPTHPDVILLNADLMLSKQNKPAAAVRYHNAVRQANSLGPALIGSYQLAIEGIETDAFTSLFEGLASNPNVNTFATHLLADFYFRAQNFDAAKLHYIAISNAQSYTALPMVLNNLANIYIMEEKYDAASNFATQAYEIVQTNSYVLSTLGWINTLQGNYNDGLDLLRQAYSMNAQEPNLRYYIAFTLNKLDRTAESKRELSILLSDFNNFDKREAAVALQAKLNG